jgi:hypothetical protein
MVSNILMGILMKRVLKLKPQFFMKKKTIIFCLSILYSCNGQNQNDIINEKNMQMEKVLKSQLEYGIPNYSNPYEYSNTDFEVLLPITKNELKSGGFKFPNNDEFITKIKLIFNRTIDLKSASKHIYINFLDRCDRSYIYYPNNILAYFGVFAIKNDNYITDSYALPQIMDYEKIFPHIVNYENNLPRKSIFENGEEVSRYLWKDENNLLQKRQANVQTLINRNKYLFNDNKASLVWLKFNDEYFLESLVKTFGYVQDRDLLKWVLDRNLNDDEFDKLLFTRTCDNKFVFHKEIFEVMAQADAKSKENYMQYLLARIDLPKVDDLSFSDATKIKALYCYYATKFMGSIESSSIYSFFPKLQEEKYEDEFRKNNYYDLPDFKELYNDTKYGGIGLPE